MSAVRKGAAIVLGVLATLAVARLSVLPLAFADEDSGLVRLSWRLDGVTVEECVRLSDEELANLPVHMRNPEACIGQIADYELRVEVDGRGVVRDTVRPAGVRGDRPIYVFSDVRVQPGVHPVEVRFRALVPDDYSVDDRPVEFRWSGTVALAPGDVGLITLDEAGRRLVLRSPATGGVSPGG